jgi:hypothetical protein
MGFKDEYDPIKQRYDELIEARIDLLRANDNEALIRGGLEFREKEAELVFELNKIKVKYGIAGADKTMKAPRKTRVRQCEEQIQSEEKQLITPNTTGGILNPDSMLTTSN